MLPRPTIEAFDRHLLGLGLRFEGVVIGGSALGLMGVIQRPTRDFDILVPELPPAIASAARDFAKAQRQAGVDLTDDWLNNGPMQLGEVLPAGWRERVQRIFDGQVLVLSTLGRPDLLKSKLFALCDRGTDLPDCIALAPTAEELAECVPWLEVQDGNELWPAHVRATVADLARRLGPGVSARDIPGADSHARRADGADGGYRDELRGESRGRRRHREHAVARLCPRYGRR